MEGQMSKVRTLKSCLFACVFTFPVLFASSESSASPALGVINPIVLEAFVSFQQYESTGNGIVASKNVSSVAAPGGGTWCITPTSPLPKQFYVTTQFEYMTSSANGSYSNGGIVWYATNFYCPAGQLEIQTGVWSNGNFSPQYGSSFVVIVTQ